MIQALISGKLWACPEAKVGQQSGKGYVMAKVRTLDSSDGSDGQFVTLFAYSAQVQTVLMALGKGAAVAVTGPLKLGTWTDQQGQARVQATMVVDACLTLHERRHADKTVAAGRAPRAPASAPAPTPALAALTQTGELWRRPTQPADGADGLDDGRPLDF